MSKELSERKKRILNALVEIYIKTGVPVSSGDIQSKYLPDVSSATVRSELSALESMGYIEQPHTSAGRIPLAPAYKVYVNSIERAPNALTDAETLYLKNEFESRINQVEDISKQAAKVISDMTNYTSIFVSKSLPDVLIEEIKLVKLMGNKVVVIISTDGGVIADKTISIPTTTQDAYINSASQVLNKVFAGKHIYEFENIDAKIEGEIGEFRELFDAVLSIIQNYLANQQDKVVVEGALKMLDYPDYDTSSAKTYLSVLQDEDKVQELVSIDDEIETNVSVKVGKEESGMDNCSVISASYTVNGKVVGQAGVVGPNRMDYRKVFDVLEYMKHALTSMLGNKNGGKDEE